MIKTNGVVVQKKNLKQHDRKEVRTIFIEELYYDNISVQELSLKGDKEYRKQLATLCELEAYLNERLKGKYLTAFQRFGEAWNGVNNETNKNYFIEGFRLGALFAYEVFCHESKLTNKEN